MKCTACHENEAVCTENCLVIEHSTMEIGFRRQISEKLSGVKTVGLCKKCQKKAAREQVGKSKYGAMIVLTCGMIGFFAGFLFLESLSSQANSESSKGNPNIEMIRILLGVLVAFCLIVGLLLYFVIIPRYLLKKKPFLLFPCASTDQERYVPFKKEYYKDLRSFQSMNRIGLDETSKKLYALIESDQIVIMLAAAVLASEQNSAADLPDDGSTLNRCVNRLLELYRKKPEGYLTTQADEVRAVGKELAEEGGFDLMLQAHKLFAQQNPRMARNLEMVWDGIGGWQG